MNTMKSILSLVILIAVNSIHAGTIKLPGANVTRNAGTSFPILVQASGFPAGSKAMISLVNAKTWAVTPWLFDQPIVNGNNTIQVPIDWSFWEVGNYLVKVNIANNHCTSTWLAKIRSAVIWPYAGTVFTRGQAAAVTWVIQGPIAADILYVEMWDDDGGEVLFLGVADPADGRLDFIVPETEPGSTYRIYLDGSFVLPEEFEDWWFPTDSSRSEKITIR